MGGLTTLASVGDGSGDDAAMFWWTLETGAFDFVVTEVEEEGDARDATELIATDEDDDKEDEGDLISVVGDGVRECWWEKEAGIVA